MYAKVRSAREAGAEERVDALQQVFRHPINVSCVCHRIMSADDFHHFRLRRKFSPSVTRPAANEIAA
jgi:hypothetical protein